MTQKKKATSSPLQASQNEVVVEFTSSLSFDRGLYFWDILGSLAHVDSLLAANILTSSERNKISNGLKGLLKGLQKGEVELMPELEDIHMNVEALLGEKIGPLAGKLHTGRSRNDQVSLDLRLYSRERILETIEGISELQKMLLSIAKDNLSSIMPGLTHMQPAQPVSLAHHMMAYWFKFQRDFDRLIDCYSRMNRCPLGAGAIAGNTYPIDRAKVSIALGFSGPMENSMDAVSDRDFVAEALFALTMTMSHISSLAEEIVLWNTPQFGYIKLSPELTTGSSMMPQKRNPDIAELARAKSGRVSGSLVSLLMVLKGLPLSYNRDLQEDKEPLFDAFDTTVDSLWAIRELLGGAEFDTENMKKACLSSNLMATDLADYLVAKGLPFRESYSIVKKMSEDSSVKGIPMEEWPVSNFKKYSDLFDKDVKKFLQLDKVMNRRKIFGGTAVSAVKKSIAIAEKYTAKQNRDLEKIEKDVEGTVAMLLK